MVSVTDARTYFNINKNILYQRKFNALVSSELDKSSIEIPNCKREVFVHVENLVEKEDDDCVDMPEWVFRELHSMAGDPISVNFDSSLEEYEALSVAETLRITPLT